MIIASGVEGMFRIKNFICNVKWTGVGGFGPVTGSVLWILELDVLLSRC